MALIVTDPLTMKSYPAWLSAAVDELIVKVRHKDIWEIVDFCIAIWAKKYPEEHKKFLEEMKVYKSNRLNKYSSTKSKTLRELTILPREINYLLNHLASHRIEEYGEKKFKREFARRYPGFSPAQTI